MKDDMKPEGLEQNDLAGVIKQNEKLSQYHCSKNEISTLAYGRPFLVPCKLHFNDEDVDITYDVTGLQSFLTLKNREMGQRLRALYNVACLARETKKFSFLLSPDNLYYDVNLTPKLLKRYLRNDVQNTTDMDFLLQYKALAGSLYQDRYSFQDYYNGGIDLLKKNRFLKDVYDCDSTDELSSLLLKAYEEESAVTDQNLVTMEKGRYVRNKAIMAAAIIAACLFAACSAYMYFFKVPAQRQVIDAMNAFLNHEYEQTAETLSTIPVNQLTLEDKYILAYSYVNMEQLTDGQRENILRDIKISSEADFDDGILDYWIYIGRNQGDEAVDLAKSINDTQLLAYALLHLEAQVNSDRNLSGEEKQEKLTEIQKQLDEISAELNPEEKESF
jgi:type VII secretion protein EssB